MAKKKKGRKGKAAPEPKGDGFFRSKFMKQTWAFVLLVLAFLVLIGNFGIGGRLPAWLGQTAAQGILGGAAYVLPVAFIYWAVLKFKHEEKKIPFANLLSMSAVLLTLAALLRVLSDQVAGEDSLGNAIHEGTGGGVVGGFLGGLTLGLLDKIPAAVIWGALLVIATSFAFAITLSHYVNFFGKLKPRRREREESEDMGRLKSRMAGSFKLNEGVPVEHHEGGLADKPTPRLSSLKNSGQKLAVSENHAALTIKNDPNWQFPAMDLLNQRQDKADAGDVEGNAQTIQDTLANFNINVEMEGANIGPRVTQYTLKPPTGVKLTKITSLENNIALDLAAHAIRIEAPIPGKRAVGIEVPNVKAATVRLASNLQSREWRELKSPLGFAIGKDIAGASVVGALDKMPHLLIAGQTGSGKSVMINTLLTSLLYRNSPAELKLILVDPKQVELAPYNDIPHLLTPVITEPEKCISALKWAVAEMERRLRTFAEISKRNIAEYNAVQKDDGMPYIVIVIDELADLMMMAARDVEALVVRIAQKARAAGIHLVLATQRPSVDVITGLIKANVPARIAFTVASQVDSRTIIDQMGAEKLLGMGDMLLLTSDMPKPKRIQASLITDDETVKVCDFLRAQRPPQYDDEVVSQPVMLGGRGGAVPDMGSGSDMDDPLYKQAVQAVVDAKKASTSLLQRRLRIGYGKAARFMETMEEQGIIGPADGSRPREVLVGSVDEVFVDGPMAAAGEDFEGEAPQQPRDRFLVQ